MHKVMSRARRCTRTMVMALALGLALGGLSGVARAQYWNGSSFEDVPSTGVRVAQYLLLARGYTLTVDGKYGAQTRERVRRFQKKRGLKQTGDIDEATWNRLVVRVRRGSRGHAVRALQTLLRHAGYPVALDGSFGSQTDKKVREYQANHKMTVDGVAGPLTWRPLISDTYQ